MFCYDQIRSVARRQQLLWDVTRSLVVMLLPVITAVGLAVICLGFLPTVVGVSFGSVSLNYQMQVNKSIELQR